MGAMRRRERRNDVGRGTKGNMRSPLQLLVSSTQYNWGQLSTATGSTQLGQFSQRGTAGGGKEGKLKRVEADKGWWVGEWEEEKKSGKGGFQGR